MTALDGKSVPRNFPATASVATLCYEGLVVKKGSANTVEITASVTDTAFGILDQGFVDDEGNARTTVSGDKVAVFQLGTGAIVNVKSLASQTWTIGAAVYLSQTASANGMVETSSSNSPKLIGHYAGEGEETSSTDGDLIPVVLSMPPGATAV